MVTQDVAAVVAQALDLAPVIDGHNDWPWELRVRRGSTVAGLAAGFPGHTDIARLRAGGVGAQLWSVFVEDLPPGTDGPAAGAVV
ncbi:MAG: membrane dipeptidase, partial [Conexibacter sp.]